MSYKKPEDIRQEVNLVDYALVNGYKIDKTKSSLKWIGLENQVTGDKILVNTSKNMYFSKIDDNDKGDVIQFKANRINSTVFVDKSPETFYKALKDLNNFLGVPMEERTKELLNDKNKFIQKRQTLSDIQDKEWNHTKMVDNKFLTNSRKIAAETLQHPIFEDRLFNTYFRLRNDHIITNYGFGKYIGNELVGLEVRNDALKNIVGNHDGVFISNTKSMEKIDYVFYAESAIDAISYFELLCKHNDFDEKANNYCFLSFGGNLYDSKVDVIMKQLDLIPIHQNTKYISITDNDFDKKEEKREGKKYDVLMTVGLLNKQGISAVLKNDNELYYKITINDQLIPPEKLKELVSSQNEYVDKNIPQPERFGKYLICKDIGESKELHFPKTLNLEQSNFKTFLKFIDKQNLYIPHKSKNKDWNDDLKMIKEKKNTVNIQEPIKKRNHGTKI